MSDLKNRQRYTNSIDNELVEKLKTLSTKTKIPQSKLLDEAIEDLLEKYKKEIEEMICVKKFFCHTCKKELKLEETIYDKIAKQEYCAYCGWPIKEDHSGIIE